jgi:hypothetical protein
VEVQATIRLRLPKTDGMAATLLGLVRSVKRALAPTHFCDEDTQKLVFRAEAKRGAHDDWERRILALSDGRSVSEVVATIYRDELRRGAWAADIGVWSGLFSERVLWVINDLAAQGQIHLKSRAGSADYEDTGSHREKRDSPKAGKPQ